VFLEKLLGSKWVLAQVSMDTGWTTEHVCCLIVSQCGSVLLCSAE